MSKLSSEILNEAIKALLANSKENKRKFTETIELQVALKAYDPAKDKRFAGAVVLPHVPRPKFTVCIIGNDVHNAEAKAAGAPSMTQDDLKLLNKDKKKVKQLADSYHAFLSSAAIVRMIPRILGPGLNKAGKFPGVINANDSVKDKILEAKSTVKFQLKSKNSLCLGVAVANVGMSPAEIEANITLAVNFLVSLLPKNWQNVKRLYIKSSMGPAQKVFGV